MFIFARKYFNMPKVDEIVMDGIDYLEKEEEEIDYLVVDVFDHQMTTAFEEEEFFKLAHSRMKKDGLMSYNYVGHESNLGHVVQKMKVYFQNVKCMRDGSISRVGTQNYVCIMGNISLERRKLQYSDYKQTMYRQTFFENADEWTVMPKTSTEKRGYSSFKEFHDTLTDLAPKELWACY